MNFSIYFDIRRAAFGMTCIEIAQILGLPYQDIFTSLEVWLDSLEEGECSYTEWLHFFPGKDGKEQACFDLDEDTAIQFVSRFRNPTTLSNEVKRRFKLRMQAFLSYEESIRPVVLTDCDAGKQPQMP